LDQLSANALGQFSPLHNSGGFSSVELRRIQSVVNDHRNQLIEAWHEYFSK